MPLVLANRVQETATPNTTVSFTLAGAVAGFQTFAVIGNTNTTYYSATDSSGNWEVGEGTYSTSGPTLTRTTVYASSNSGSAVTFPGSVNVFVTYPSGKSVNLDASGNVSALGTVSSGTWQGSTVGVAYGGTGVTTSSGPNSVVLRDANENITVNRLSQGLQTITASGGTTTLTAASDFNQQLVGTGGHTFRLPDATTLTDTTTFQFNNNATGTLTIENNAGTTVGTVAPGGAAGIALMNNATSGGTWDVHGYIPENVTWGTNSLALGSTVITGGTWNGGTITSAYGGTGLTTFGAANGALYSTSASALTAGTLPVAAGGTGTTTPSLVAGTNVTISGAWPNQTINASGGGGGSSPQVGQVYVGTNAPTTGTWLETNKYYSKATYPALAAVIGDIEDFGNLKTPTARFPLNITYPGKNDAASGGTQLPFYAVASNGSIAVTVGDNAIRVTTDGINWNPVANGKQSTVFYGVYFVNGIFIAVADQGFLHTSTNGIDWIVRSIGIGIQLGSVAFGAGVYVTTAFIGGNSGNTGLFYSSDLNNWTMAANGLTGPTVAGSFSSLIYANGLFVATSVFNGIYTSVDGINWTQRATTTNTRDLIYANGLFVALANTVPIVTSPDGFTWTVRSVAGMGASVSLRKVIYANGLFVAVGGGGGGNSATIVTSPDGITWTIRNSSYVLPSLNFVAWNGTNFIAVATSGVYYVSPNGITWTPQNDVSMANFICVDVVFGRTIAFGQKVVVLAGGSRVEQMTTAIGWNGAFSAQNAQRASPQSIAYNGTDLYVAVGSNNGIYTSSDGVEWTGRFAQPASAVAGTANFDKVYYVNNTFIAMGGFSTNQDSVFTSTDGITWTVRNFTQNGMNAAAALGSTIVVVGQGSTATNCYSSTNGGVSWTGRSVAANALSDITTAFSLFVAVGQSGIFTSPDGTTWTQRNNTSNLQRVVFFPSTNTLVACGNSGAIRFSTDGINWNQALSGTGSGVIYDVAFNGSLYCAVGSSGAILTSTDLQVWTNRNPINANPLFLYVVWGDGKFVAAANNNGNSLFSSTDGITWQRVSTASGLVAFSVYFLGNRFLSYNTGVLQTSTDGFTWNMANPFFGLINNAVRKLQKLGSYWYASTTSGAFQSTDGINFSWIRSSTQGQVRGFAYNGTFWLCLLDSTAAAPLSVLKSFDGINWFKSGVFSAIARATASATVVDIVFANGRFIVLFVAPSSSANIVSNVYTSVDGVTWTPTPMFLNVTPSYAISDGTNAVLAGINRETWRSTDGGLTWTPLFNKSGQPVYSNGAWCFVNTNDQTTTFSTDLSTSCGSGYADIAYFYVNNGYMIGFTGGGAKFFGNVNAPAFISLPVKFDYTYSSPVGATLRHEITFRGDTALLTNFANRVESHYPYYTLEYDRYSYNTTTTFWVPPNVTGGQRAWVYAGP